MSFSVGEVYAQQEAQITSFKFTLNSLSHSIQQGSERNNMLDLIWGKLNNTLNK